MATLQRPPGRKVTRQLRKPDSWLFRDPKNEPGINAEMLAANHNQAVADYGSNSGGFHAYNPSTMTTAGVYDDGPFPDGTVVSNLAWGRISDEIAQRLLETDGVA